jgi:hypothetical protein
MNHCDSAHERALMAALLRPDVFRMQIRLYGPETRRITPVSDAVVWGHLRQIRADVRLDRFRIWLVGSRLEPSRDDSDVDLVLAPRVGYQVSDQAIDEALYYCRDHALWGGDQACIVDPWFRVAGPTLDLKALAPDTVMPGTKLFSPKLMHDVLAGRIVNYRRLGLFSIDYVRRARDTDYYRKLPRRSFDGLLSPYLRPAIEIL